MASPPSARRSTLSCDSQPRSSLAGGSRLRSASETGPMPTAPDGVPPRAPARRRSAPALLGRRYDSVGLPFGEACAR
jgi:hypothetical protein